MKIKNIINDSLHYTLFPRNSNWLAKHSLYHYLEYSDSSLADSSAVIQHFLDSTRNSNMGIIDAAEQLLNDSNGVSPSDLIEAQALMNSLVSPDTAEALYQTVFDTLINMYTMGNLLPDSLQQVALRPI